MQFLYNENREVVAEKDYSGNIIRYIRGLGLISSDSENAKTYYHYVCDEQGSVSRIIRGEDKENGAAAQDKVSDRVLNHYEYVLGDSNYSIDKYLDDANYIINNGTYAPELNGYVSFMSGKKYGFVGLDRTTGDITTFHIKNISELIKKAPSLGFER